MTSEHLTPEEIISWLENEALRGPNHLDRVNAAIEHLKRIAQLERDLFAARQAAFSEAVRAGTQSEPVGVLSKSVSDYLLGVLFARECLCDVPRVVMCRTCKAVEEVKRATRTQCETDGDQ